MTLVFVLWYNPAHAAIFKQDSRYSIDIASVLTCSGALAGPQDNDFGLA